MLTLAGPAVAILFAAVFLGIWSYWKRLRYLLWLAAAFFLFSLAALSQILLIPHDFGLNAVVSCILYTVSVLVFADGILMRLGLRSNYFLNLSLGGVIVGGIAYFYYIDRSLHARIYILNFGLALLLLATALKTRRAARRPIDRVLFWTLFIFALQFFPRTIFTLGYVGSGRDLATLTQSPFWIWLNFSFIVFTVMVGLALSAAVVSDIVSTLHRKATTDPLTGLLNRRGFEEFAKHLVSRAAPHPLRMIVFDIDEFKSINDLYGHHGGDEVLVRLGSLISENIRVSDAAARLGGEEFAVLISNLDRNDVYALAERLRNEIAQTRFGSGRLRKRMVTASFGVAEVQRGENLQEALRRADEMLYAAKRAGRNRTIATWLSAGFAAQ